MMKYSPARLVELVVTGEPTLYSLHYTAYSIEPAAYTVVESRAGRLAERRVTQIQNAVSVAASNPATQPAQPVR